MVGDTPDEQQLKDGWLANGKVELSDALTQMRILTAIYDWDWNDLLRTGEAKILERIETYKQRGVRPNEALLKAMQRSMNAPTAQRANLGSLRASESGSWRYRREGD